MEGVLEKLNKSKLITIQCEKDIRSDVQNSYGITSVEDLRIWVQRFDQCLLVIQVQKKVNESAAF